MAPHPSSTSASESLAGDNIQQQSNKNERVVHKPQDTKAVGNTVELVEDEPDEWDERIFSTGCSVENTRLNDCYFERKDWRACKAELEAFKECWKRQGNVQRTAQEDA